jgi:hypothetical protein
MPFLPLLVLVLGAPVLVAAFLAFQRLVTIQRDRHTDVWNRDGSPMLFRSFLSGIAAQRCMLVWVFRTPTWVEADTDSRAQLRRMRIAVAIWNFAVVPLFILVSLASLP